MFYTSSSFEIPPYHAYVDILPLADPVIEKKVKGLSIGGGGGRGGEGGHGGGGGGGGHGGGGGGGSNKLGYPGKGKGQIVSVVGTYNKKTEKYYHIFSGSRAGLWLKFQLVGKKRKRMRIMPIGVPVLVFHNQNCIQGFSGSSCRYCFQFKKKHGLAWTPIGHSPIVSL